MRRKTKKRAGVKKKTKPAKRRTKRSAGRAQAARKRTSARTRVRAKARRPKKATKRKARKAKPAAKPRATSKPPKRSEPEPEPIIPAPSGLENDEVITIEEFEEEEDFDEGFGDEEEEFHPEHTDNGF